MYATLKNRLFGGTPAVPAEVEPVPPPDDGERQMTLARIEAPPHFPGGVALTLAPRPGGALAEDLAAPSPVAESVLSEIRERVAALPETAALAAARRRAAENRAELSQAERRAEGLRADVAAAVRDGRAAEPLETELADAERRAATLARRTPILEAAERAALRPAESAARSVPRHVIDRALPMVQEKNALLAEKAARAADHAAAEWARSVADYQNLVGMMKDVGGLGVTALEAAGSD